jgi:PTH1 family peptidyl-tRNA hydrolase
VTWLVAGLGNPGPSYARTRHNAGAMVVEAMAEAAGERFRKRRFIAVEVAEIRDPEAGELLVLARPATFMNLCGPPLASLARKIRVGVDRVIACHDEIDLPFGSLQVKQGGSTAGHQGLNSMVGAFRSRDFYRVRLGVGRPPGRQDPADYVLELFSPRERTEVEVLVQEAVDAVRSLVRDGLAVTQDRYNRGGGRRR